MTGSEATATVTIVNTKGLHARASARFVTAAEAWNADITVCYGEETVPACSIMGLMMLGAGLGASITIHATGPEATEAVDALATLVAQGFGETD